MKIEIAKDKDGYTAKVSSWKHLVAFGFSKQEALEELSGVVELELESEKDIRQITKKINECLQKLEEAS